MKLWATLPSLFLLAALGAVAIAPRLQPSELERRHATIRAGMREHEVYEIMKPGDTLPDETPSAPGAGHTWSYVVSRGMLARDARLDVEFDDNRRVIRTAVEGIPVQPPYKWGNP